MPDLPHIPQKLQPLGRAGVIAVLRGPTYEAAVAAAEALITGGITAIEVTYSTPSAAPAIATIKSRFPDVLVGAGTLTREPQVVEADAAGADFLVSPGTIPALAEAMLDTGRPTLTGALTPTEVMTAIDLGISAIKIFPGSLVGPGYLKALRGPFPDIGLMPTGGVSADNIGDWLEAGAFAVGAGSELCSRDDMASQDWDKIVAKARRFAQAWETARG